MGARKPSTSTVCSRAAASFASSTVGLSSSVDVLDKRRELRNNSRDYRLRRIEYFRPHFLGYVLSHVTAGYDDGFSQGKVLRAPDSFAPRLFELIFDAPYQFVELL